MKPIGAVLQDMGWDKKLRDLAGRVDRNIPQHANPERFHIEKSEIVDALKSMSRGQE
jgi:hypothetical protein